MVTSARIGLILLGASVVGLLGCSDAGGEGDQQSADLTTGNALEVKASGITVWIDPVAYATERFDQPAWRIEGRTSKNLENVFSFSSDDEMGEAIQNSARKFDVFLDASQLDHMLAGYRLIVDLDATSGAQRQYFISFKLGAKLERFHGSSKITLRKTLTPFLQGQEIRYRNLVGVAAGYDGLTITTEAGGGPLAIGALGNNTPVDWDAAGLLGVAADPEGEMSVSVSKGASTVTRYAGVDVAVSSLKITTDPLPLTVWPDPTCTAAMQACVDALPSSQADTSSCGAAIEVRRCEPRAPDGDAPTAAVFADDLVDGVADWYALHGQDAAASGGNTLAEAQAFVSADKVAEVTDPEEDPFAHDLADFIVFRHPDMVWPGSDIVWFGAYDRASGALVEIYDFN